MSITFKFPASLCLLLLSFSLLAESEVVNMTDNWRVLREYRGEAPPKQTEKWLDLKETLTRDFRLKHPYEPGMEVWLSNSFEVPKALRKEKYLVLSLGNRRLLGDVFLNGKKLLNIGDTQWQGGKPEAFTKVAKSDPRGRMNGHFINLVRENKRWDVPELFLVPSTVLKDGENVVNCQIWEADAYGEYLNHCELRAPKLGDLFFPITYSQVFGATGSEAVVKFLARVPITAKVTMEIEVQDYMGKTLRQETQEVEYQGKTLIIPIKPKSLNDYKAIITLSWNGERSEQMWVYYTPRLKVGPERQSFSLRGAWRFRGLKMDEKTRYPLPDDGWKLAYVPGQVVACHKRNLTSGHWQGEHRCYLTRKFNVPAELKAEQLILRLGSVVVKGDIYLNGKLLGDSSIHTSPVEYDVTDLINRDGENEIHLVLTDWSAFLKEGTPQPKDGEIKPARCSSLTGNALSIRLGLYGFVELLAAPKVRVKRIWAIPSVKNDKLTVKTWLENHSDSEASVKILHQVEDKTGKLLEFDGEEVKIPAKSVVAVETVKSQANLPLWSLEKPNLCGLTVSLLENEKIIDRDFSRFGYRDIDKNGRDILLNGKKVNLRGSSDGLKTFYYPKDAGAIAYMARGAKKRGYNILRVQGMICVPPIFWDVYDEVGYFANAESSLDDMSNARIAYGDPRLHDNGIEEIKHFILEAYNHPSILAWNYGNEVFYGQMSKNKKLEAGFSKVARTIKAFDPTRLVTQDGSSDFPGADTYNPHYPRFQGLTNELHFLFHPINHYDYTKEQAAADVTKGRGNYLLRSIVRPWSGEYPMMTGEFSWMRVEHPGESYDFFGEAAMKPGPTRMIGGHPMVSTLAAFGFEREQDFKGLRIAGIAACIAHQKPQLPVRYAKPIIAVFKKLNSRFAAGEPFEREVVVFNDTGEKRALKIELVWKDGEKELGRLQKDVELESAGRADFSFTVPAIKADQIRPINAELSVSGPGVERFVDPQEWTIWPKNAQKGPFKTKIGLFDPANTLKGLFDEFAVEVKNLENLDDLQNIDLLVLGEDLATKVLKENGKKIQEFVKSGGNCLITRQNDFKDLLPFDLEKYKFYETLTCSYLDIYSGLSVIHAKHHPIFEGMLPEDMKSWGGDELALVHSVGYKPPTSGNTKVLSGLLPKYATLIESNYGKGRFLINGLELTPVKVKNEPAAVKLLANILKYVEKQPVTPGKILVLAGKDGDTCKALKGKIRLVADYRATPPESLENYSLIILCDWDEKAPLEDFAPKLREYLLKGGQVLVERPDEKTQRWLEKVIEAKIEAKKHLAKRVVKRVTHPLLDGMADGDFAWVKGGRKWAFNGKKESPKDIIRSVVVPEGALSLTQPAALSVMDVGKGQLILSQIRWPYGAADRGARLQLALLSNLGAELEHFKTKIIENKSEYETLLTFQPIDIRAACNRSRCDKAPNDETGGWIDLGAMDLRMLPSGPQYMNNGVLFDVVNEQANKNKGCVILAPSPEHSKAPPATRKLIVESEPITVERHADYLFFLHTAAYDAEAAGTPVMAYEIRYEGFKKMIPGMDFTEVVSKVPVKTKVHIQDWITGPKGPVIPYAWKSRAGAGEGKVDCQLYCMKWRNPKPDKKIESIRIVGVNAKCIPIVLAISTANTAENLLPGGDIAKVAPCGAICTSSVQKPAYPEQIRIWRGGWTGNFWRENSAGEICSGKVPEHPDEIAMHIKTTAGSPCGQMWLKNRISLEPNATYAISMNLLGMKKARGSMAYRVRNEPVPVDIKMDALKYGRHTPASPLTTDYFDNYVKIITKTPIFRCEFSPNPESKWKMFNSRFHTPKTVDSKIFHVQFQNRGQTDQDVFYFKDIKLWKINENNTK